MQSLLKINLNGGLKRLVSTLICLMMILATFPMHMLSSTVFATELKNASDFASLKDQLTGSNMTIKLTANITVSNSGEGMAGDYVFDFTDSKFNDKTITIEGNNHTMTIDNANLSFLKVGNCTVILKNITIDANKSIERGTTFIYKSSPTSALNMTSVNITNLVGSGSQAIAVVTVTGKCGTNTLYNEFMGVYPSGASITPPYVGGYTFSRLAGNGCKEGGDGQYILDLNGITSNSITLQATYAQNKYKLQYKDADASEGTEAKAIGEATGYTLDGLKTNFETVMSAQESNLENSKDREFEGWKLGGSTFSLPTEPTGQGQEKEEVDWDNLLENAVQGKNLGEYTITFQAVWGPQKYVIQYMDEKGLASIAVQLVPSEIGDGVEVEVDWVDGSNNSINVQESGDIPAMEPQNSKNGHSFSGWVYGTNIAFSGVADWTSLATAATSLTNGVKKIVFKAQYDAIKYFIKYINAGGDYISVHYEGSNDNFYAQELPFGGKSPQVYAPSTKYYTFDHWEYGKNANNPYTAKNFQIGGSDVTWEKLLTKVESGKVILVKAIYSPIKYTIKYRDGESDAVVAAETQDEYTTSEDTLDSAIPDAFNNGVKTGYRFNRWTYVSILGRRRKLIPGRTKWRNLVDGAVLEKEKDVIVLSADYGPITYTINYDPGAGSFSGTAPTSTYAPTDSGDNQTSNPAVISTTTPTKTGYYFDKWTYGENKTDFTANNTTWEKLISSATQNGDGKAGTITLTANFAPIEYTIKYASDDADCSGLPMSNTYTPSDSNGSKTSDTATISTTTPTKTGYYFEKWTYGDNTAFGANTTWADLVSSAVLGANGTTGTITLKANFKPITYDIKYIDDEKSSAGGSKNPVSYTSDSTFSLDGTPELDNGSKLGYAFSHWTYGDGDKETDFTANSTKWKDLVLSATLGGDGKTGTITLTAHFEPITYTIRYQTNGGDDFQDETYTTNEEGKPLDAVVNLNKKPKKYNNRPFRMWLYGKSQKQFIFESGTTRWEDLVRTAVGGVIYFTASYSA